MRVAWWSKREQSHPYAGVTTIHLVLTDDWELRGDGSGEMRRIQFYNLRRLARIYEDAGLRGSFNAEVMQQLSHLRVGHAHAKLLDLALEWEDVLRAAFARGHDVQLHIHPQWHDASYVSGAWQLTSDWTIGKHPSNRIAEMVKGCKLYLESLLKPLDATYECVSFRAGTWALIPSHQVVPALIDAGIELDISVAPGLMKSGPVDVDYRDVDEALLPYHPDMTDARRLSVAPTRLICVPTSTFAYAPLHKIHDVLLEFLGAGADRVPNRYGDAPNWIIRAKSIARYHSRSTHYVCDLSALSFGVMCRALDEIRRRCDAADAATVPVIMTNHTKDLTNFDSIARFAQLVSHTPEVEVITLSQLARNLRRGCYPVVVRGTDGRRESLARVPAAARSVQPVLK